VVGLADPPDVAIDLSEFNALLEAGRLVDAIAALGEGELLPELDFDWVFRERDRLRERVSSAIAGIAAASEAAGDRPGAIEWLRRRIERDPFDEPAHRDLIEALNRAGDRGGAIVVYERLSERLRRELGVAPSAATRGLAASLRTEQVAFAGARAGDVTESARRAPEARPRAVARGVRRSRRRADPAACGVGWCAGRRRRLRGGRRRGRHRQDAARGVLRR
jgi:DNA-binding SARP family transcriptional activator